MADRADAGLLAATLGEGGPRLAAEVAARHPALVVRDATGAYHLHGEFRAHVRRRLDGDGGDRRHATTSTSRSRRRTPPREPGRRARGTGSPRGGGPRPPTRSGAPWPAAPRRRTPSSGTWLDRLPEDVLLQAELGPAKASLLVRTGQPDAAGSLLERAFSGHRLDSGARDRLVRSLGALYAQRGRPPGKPSPRAGPREAVSPARGGAASRLGAGGAGWRVRRRSCSRSRSAALVLWLPPGGPRARARSGSWPSWRPGPSSGRGAAFPTTSSPSGWASRGCSSAWPRPRRPSRGSRRAPGSSCSASSGWPPPSPARACSTGSRSSRCVAFPRRSSGRSPPSSRPASCRRCSSRRPRRG